MSAPTYTPEQIMERFADWLHRETESDNGLKRTWTQETKDHFYTKTGMMLMFTKSLAEPTVETPTL